MPPLGDLVLSHVTVVEPGLGRARDRTLRIEGGRIASLVDGAGDPGGAEWAGHFVMPGLVDLHVHLPPPLLPAELRAVLLAFLAHGVTTVRDAGSPWAWSLGTRDRVAAGELPGPRVLSCGPLLVGRESWPGAWVIDDPEEVPRIVAKLRATRADCVKVLDSVSPAVAGALRGEAHRAGLHVIGHVPAEADELLLDEPQHLTGLAAALRTRHPAAIEQAIARSLAEHAAHTPTLVVLERFARASEGSAGCGPSCRFLPAYFEAVLWDPRRIPALAAMTADLGFAPRERFEAAKALVGALHHAGVPILAGTDSPTFRNAPGASLYEEIALLREAGLAAEEALAAATTRAAAALGDPYGGRIVPGARADLVILRSDPVEAILRGDTLDIAGVVAGGRLYRREAMARQLAGYERFFARSAYARVVDAAVRIAVPR